MKHVVRNLKHQSSHSGIRGNPGIDSLAISSRSQKRNLIGENEPKIVTGSRGTRSLCLLDERTNRPMYIFSFQMEGKKQGQFQTDHFLSMMGERVVLMGSGLGTFINMDIYIL